MWKVFIFKNNNLGGIFVELIYHAFTLEVCKNIKFITHFLHDRFKLNSFLDMNELNQAYLGCSVMLKWKLSWELLVGLNYKSRTSIPFASNLLMRKR